MIVNILFILAQHFILIVRLGSTLCSFGVDLMELAQIGKATAKMISENKRAGKGGELFQKMADKTLRRLAAIERVSEEKKSKKAVYSDPAKPGPVKFETMNFESFQEIDFETEEDDKQQHKVSFGCV